MFFLRKLCIPSSGQENENLVPWIWSHHVPLYCFYQTTRCHNLEYSKVSAYFYLLDMLWSLLPCLSLFSLLPCFILILFSFLTFLTLFSFCLQFFNLNVIPTPFLCKYFYFRLVYPWWGWIINAEWIMFTLQGMNFFHISNLHTL
jgi:hypothetical protein